MEVFFRLQPCYCLLAVASFFDHDIAKKNFSAEKDLAKYHKSELNYPEHSNTKNQRWIIVFLSLFSYFEQIMIMSLFTMFRQRIIVKKLALWKNSEITKSNSSFVKHSQKYILWIFWIAQFQSATKFEKRIKASVTNRLKTRRHTTINCISIFINKKYIQIFC